MHPQTLNDLTCPNQFPDSRKWVDLCGHQLSFPHSTLSQESEVIGKGRENMGYGEPEGKLKDTDE